MRPFFFQSSFVVQARFALSAYWGVIALPVLLADTAVAHASPDAAAFPPDGQVDLSKLCINFIVVSLYPDIFSYLYDMYVYIYMNIISDAIFAQTLAQSPERNVRAVARAIPLLFSFTTSLRRINDSHARAQIDRSIGVK